MKKQPLPETENIIAKAYPALTPKKLTHFLSLLEPDRWALAYRGYLENFVIVKALVLANPDLVSYSWIEENKQFFTEIKEGEEEILDIKEEFKDIPFLGLNVQDVLTALSVPFSQRDFEGNTILELTDKKIISVLKKI